MSDTESDKRLVGEIVSEVAISEYVAKRVLEVVVSHLTEQLKTRQEIKLSDLGTFKIVHAPGSSGALSFSPNAKLLAALSLPGRVMTPPKPPPIPAKPAVTITPAKPSKVVPTRPSKTRK